MVNNRDVARVEVFKGNYKLVSSGDLLWVTRKADHPMIYFS